MKALVLAAAFGLSAPAPPPPALGKPSTVEAAADLARDCADDPEPCTRAITWLRNNTAACIRFDLTDKEIVDQVIAWLRKHPKQTGIDDNDLVRIAIDGLWPCN